MAKIILCRATREENSTSRVFKLLVSKGIEGLGVKTLDPRGQNFLFRFK